MTDSALPPERLQHGRITRDVEQVADAAGGVGAPYRVEGLLGRMERHGDIGLPERLAGEKFAELFTQANFAHLRAADMARNCHAPLADELNGIAAREAVNACLSALGGHGSSTASAAWFILGEQISIRQWSMREGWGNRPISPHVAKGIIIAVLQILRHHFGM